MYNLKEVAQETLSVIRSGRYRLNGEEIALPATYGEICRAEAISPEEVRRCRQELSGLSVYDKTFVSVNILDSFEAAKSVQGRVLVHNFANAFHPGGGFLRGAPAQEEALCRESTLYASLSSGAAAQVYEYNANARTAAGSDYMIVSPKVVVFRDSACNFLREPFTTSVISYAAPDLEGDAYELTDEEVRPIMLEKIKNMLSVAAVKGYDALVLGAWGCGAFCHDAKDMAENFRQVLFAENYRRHFSQIVFAVYSPRGSSYNYKRFLERLGGGE